ncbi:MAG: sensor histidine kinase, partial [Micromonosporaceae bacterium]|nr:sensor histidine kinase [Micromonosporaceae bacterium]
AIRPRGALLVALIQVIGTHFAAHNQLGARPLNSIGYALLVAGPVAMLFRRRYRIPALLVAGATTVAYLLVGYPYGPVFLAVLVIAVGGIMDGHRRSTWIIMGAGYLSFVAVGLAVTSVAGVQVRRVSLGDVIAVAAWTLVALAVAEAARNRASALREIARTRAEQERGREEQERRRASEQRLLIARELHDVIGHHLSLINVQAGVGLHLMDERPEQARTSLQAIKQASAEALREVRSVLGALRPEDEQAPRTPAPSLADLSALVDSGDTQVVVEGQPRRLPPELDRAAYRIIQEALTNVRRHAGAGAVATLTIGYHPEELTLRIDDNGVGGRIGDGGSGLTGMRERATALGGSLAAGPLAAGGFRVSARLPLPGEAMDGEGGGTR